MARAGGDMDSGGRGDRVLVVDDTPQSVRLLHSLLEPEGYAVRGAGSGEEALSLLEEDPPDLVLLDLMMPGLDGHEVCRRLRSADASRYLPVIMLTAAGHEERVRALEAGADDFLTKPIDRAELLARVRSLLRIKRYHDRIEAQAEALADLNRNLEGRVNEQVEELARLSRLRRFLSPQVADLVTSSDEQWLFDTHRTEIAVLFCDLRGFTAFTHSAEPEDVIALLRAFHQAAGRSVRRFEATVGWFSGDGLMVFFNDPVPCTDAAARAVSLGTELRDAVMALSREWDEAGFGVGVGIGVALGYATLGIMGIEDRVEYGPVGSVVNLAARLCAQAGNGEILLSQSVHAALADPGFVSERVAPLELPGFPSPVSAWRLARSPAAVAPEPAITELPPVQPEAVNTFRREADDWLLTYRGNTVRVRDSKGLGYLARLIAGAGRELHVADLAGAVGPDAVMLGADTGPQLDARAVREYRARLQELESDRDEARDWGDLERAARAEEEIDFVTRELSAAYGLGGRPRRTQDPVERVRKAVTNRIRQAIGKVEGVHPELGRHLANSVRTGTFCAYFPESPVDWRL